MPTNNVNKRISSAGPTTVTQHNSCAVKLSKKNTKLWAQKINVFKVNKIKIVFGLFDFLIRLDS